MVNDIKIERVLIGHPYYLARSELPASIPRKKKRCVEQTCKVLNFWTISAMKSQKAAEDNENKEN